MKITVAFDSMEEFQAAMMPPKGKETKSLQKAEKPVAEAPTVAAEVAEKMPAAEVTEKTPAAREAEKTPAAKEAEKAPAVDRVEVRRALAELNKRTGKKLASELIHGMGYDKLTNVPDEKLPYLMAKIKEVENAE